MGVAMARQQLNEKNDGQVWTCFSILDLTDRQGSTGEQ